MPSTIPDPASQPRRNIYTLTYTLIALNVLVYLAMCARGVSPVSPGPRDLYNWGADFTPATLGAHQYWRLVTACFLHFGILHIGMNMYVLYRIGPFIEITFGRARYALVYAFAGILSSLTSVLIHPDAVGAGASGAIFGLYGAVFAFLLRNRRSLDPAATRSIAQSAGIFVFYNIILGSRIGNVDLSAHLGGLVAGFVAGLALAPSRPAIETR